MFPVVRAFETQTFPETKREVPDGTVVFIPIKLEDRVVTFMVTVFVETVAETFWAVRAFDTKAFPVRSIVFPVVAPAPTRRFERSEIFVVFRVVMFARVTEAFPVVKVFDT